MRDEHCDLPTHISHISRRSYDSLICPLVILALIFQSCLPEESSRPACEAIRKARRNMAAFLRVQEESHVKALAKSMYGYGFECDVHDCGVVLE